MTQDYIGTKRVTAWPQVEDVTVERARDGYAVKYADGYTSWSPKEAFEAAYQPITAMGFEGALWAMKHGHKVRRIGWMAGVTAFIEEGNVLVIKNGDETASFDPDDFLHKGDILADDYMIVE